METECDKHLVCQSESISIYTSFTDISGLIRLSLKNFVDLCVNLLVNDFVSASSMKT